MLRYRETPLRAVTGDLMAFAESSVNNASWIKFCVRADMKEVLRNCRELARPLFWRSRMVWTLDQWHSHSSRTSR